MEEYFKHLKNTIISIPIIYFILNFGIIDEKYGLYILLSIPTFVTYVSMCEEQNKSLFNRLFFDIIGDLISSLIITLIVFLFWIPIFLLYIYIEQSYF